MSIFNIKLKTKSGNDIKKKQTITVFFRLNYKHGLRTVAEYTYRIMIGNKVYDPKVVLELKNSKEIKSIEDLTLKVMLNFVHIIGAITKKENINPDFVLFMSPDLEGKKNKSWIYLRDAFDNNKKIKTSSSEDPLDELRSIGNDGISFHLVWNKTMCDTYQVDRDQLELLYDFAQANANCHFMAINPEMNPMKYAKSLHVCRALQERIERKTSIFDEEVIQ